MVLLHQRIKATPSSGAQRPPFSKQHHRRVPHVYDSRSEWFDTVPNLHIYTLAAKFAQSSLLFFAALMRKSGFRPKMFD